mmetsp:Transcript_18642/g.26251  ORF Transcript_18642/g.26251 Transcript_18642/m.26251 type:complete len:274 (-) Transcript_18642:23-844(-)
MSANLRIRFETYSPLLVSAVLGSCSVIIIQKLYHDYILRSKWSARKNCDEGNDFQNELTCSPETALTLIKTRRSIFPKQFSGNETIPQNIIGNILEAASWAPTHNLTEPWRFIIFESKSSRIDLGKFLAEEYKLSTVKKDGKQISFSKSKFEKKALSPLKSSFVIAICVKRGLRMNKNPFVEEISSVAMAVQNMHLVVCAYSLGAYWSSGGIYEDKTKDGILNPNSLKSFLRLDNDTICLGFFYVGKFSCRNSSTRKWPKGRRSNIEDKVIWR